MFLIYRCSGIRWKYQNTSTFVPTGTEKIKFMGTHEAQVTCQMKYHINQEFHLNVTCLVCDLFCFPVRILE